MIHPKRKTLSIPQADDAPDRPLPVPHELIAILRKGKESGADMNDFIFPGRRQGKPLCRRVIESTVHRARKAAGINKPVTAMTLRHSYAIHQLERGINLRELQLALGLTTLQQVLRYADCIPPEIQDLLIENPGQVSLTELPPPPTDPTFPLTPQRRPLIQWFQRILIPPRRRRVRPPGG